MKDFEGTIDSLAALALLIYVVVVVLRGNGKALMERLSRETGFAEFALALFILSQIAKIPELKPLVSPVIVLACVIVAMRIAEGSNVSAFSDFANGRAGLFQTIGRVFSSQS